VNGVWAVVPVKCFAHGKSRLADVLSSDAREELARALCEHALTVLSQCDAIAGVLVATDCALVERFAEERGALVVRDAAPSEGDPAPGSGADVAGAPAQTPRSLAAIVDRVLGVLASRGAPAALVVMADLPLLAVSDVSALVTALDHAAVVLAPDRGDQGTNALALSPPDRIATCFGSEVSFSRHVARANEHGAAMAVHRSDGVLFDLDSPGDLALAQTYADRGALLSWNRKRPSRVRAA